MIALGLKDYQNEPFYDIDVQGNFYNFIRVISNSIASQIIASVYVLKYGRTDHTSPKKR